MEGLTIPRLSLMRLITGVAFAFLISRSCLKQCRASTTCRAAAYMENRDARLLEPDGKE